MGIDILGFDHMKDQKLSVMVNDDDDRAQTIENKGQTIELNNAKLFFAPAAYSKGNSHILFCKV